ncbi:acyl-CoA dehydrogenase family protein [Paraburkholderia tropica]|uniref:acyl-CoA dehydrogenase family protein n=1 Tax=Paraburkholderia tropica TaxID=92647 RepID=UPI0007EC701F|nr:acyl-CoA dehydrogenase family protein [Paraburkholderia tropica]MBB2980008.1 alkylation response protein AidB-like acyl-CoA dehydrogenase [Paraburkholderia tropica]OBR54305.1 monooxygenase [Paraburkholderia tropica]
MSQDRTAPLPPGIVTGPAWGEPLPDTYAQAAAPFRPLFARIREHAAARETERSLPYEALEWLREARLTAARVPREHGGLGLSLPEFFELLIELSEAESNLTQALRAHFGFVEHILASDPERQARWFARLANGAIAGAAWSETGEAKQAQFSTRLTRTPDGWRLNGTKFYTTGSLFADWIHVGASDENGESVSLTIARRAPGVDVIDDWDGMGQRLTASGTSRFSDVPVEEHEIVAGRAPFAYSEAYYQLVHLATLAGINRAAANEAAALVAARTRSYSHAPAARPADDAQVLQVIGRVRAHAWTASAAVAQAARALERAERAVGQAHEAAAIAEAEIEIWQAQTVVSQLVLDATANVFDALGASATLRPQALDRHWRNARTITSHNPRIYKDRIVGEFAVKGTLPAGQWRIGVAG